MMCLVTLYFFMRHFLSNFLLFFLWLLLLPIIYVVNLWHYYGGALRAGTDPGSILGWLPQFGGMHAYSLGIIDDTFLRKDAWLALVNGALWTLLALVCGVLLFNRKKL